MPRGFADQHLAVGRQGDIAREGLSAEADALRARNHYRSPAAQHGRGRIRSAKINPYDRHSDAPPVIESNAPPQPGRQFIASFFLNTCYFYRINERQTVFRLMTSASD
jgi:hypothetical protein